MGSMSDIAAALTVLQFAADGVDVSIGEGPAKALAEEIFNLRARIAELEADKRRLDYLQGKGIRRRQIAWTGPDEGWIVTEDGHEKSWIRGEGQTVREAIDAAMDGEGE